MARKNVEDRSFFSHIPEIYRQDPVIGGLTGAFERLYLKNEAMIDTLPETLYNPSNTPEPLLDFLGNLVGLRNEHGLFLPEQMRELLPVAYRIQRKKGTRWALQEILTFYLASVCGHSVRPLIVEYDDWQGRNMPEELAACYPEIYHNRPDELTVLFPPEPLLQNVDEQARLALLVSLYTPAVATPHILVLKPYTDLDDFGYLGLNTYL